MSEKLEDQIPIDEQQSLTVSQFCGAEQLSHSAYYELQRRGLGPVETRVPGTKIIRISAHARRAWHELMQELSATKAANLERERRRQQTVAAGKKAVKSEAHISRRRARGAA